MGIHEDCAAFPEAGSTSFTQAEKKRWNRNLEKLRERLRWKHVVNKEAPQKSPIERKSSS